MAMESGDVPIGVSESGSQNGHVIEIQLYQARLMRCVGFRDVLERQKQSRAGLVVLGLMWPIAVRNRPSAVRMQLQSRGLRSVEPC